MNASVVLARVRGFLRGRAMPVVAVAAAAASCVAVPPDAGYAGYVDWGTLARLAAMLAVVASLREAGVFQALAVRLVRACRGMRRLVAVLVATTALASMFVTNDMALLAMLPLAAASLLDARRADLIGAVFVLQGLAANLCGMLMPFGNPQNIFLTSWYAIGLRGFLMTMLPPFAMSCLMIAGAYAWMMRVPGARSDVGGPDDARAPGSPEEAAPALARTSALAVLLAVCVTAVLGYVPAGIALAVVLASLIALDRGPAPLARIDWGLLVTFAAFFVFSGNLARVDAVAQAFAGWLAGGAFVPAALLSQVISNVPAAVVLSRFTGDWAGLLVGVNVGGAGTPVGSLATLIVIAQFNGLARRLPQVLRADLGRGRFFAMLLGCNFAFLAALLAAGVLLGW